MKIYKLGTSLVMLGLCMGIMLTVLQPCRAGVKIGQSAPDFSTSDAVTGKTVTLLSLLSTNKAVVLIYMSTLCPYSKGYDTRYQELANKYGSLGVAVVGVNSNDNETDQMVVEDSFEHHFTFQILKDGNNIVADKYGATHTPEAYLIDNSGKLVYHGRIDNSLELNQVKTHNLADAIDEVLAGKPVLNPETKAFGCSIKRVGL
jgi:peroxiredoxin